MVYNQTKRKEAACVKASAENSDILPTRGLMMMVCKHSEHPDGLDCVAFNDAVRIRKVGNGRKPTISMNEILTVHPRKELIHELLLLLNIAIVGTNLYESALRSTQ